MTLCARYDRFRRGCCRTEIRVQQEAGGCSALDNVQQTGQLIVCHSLEEGAGGRLDPADLLLVRRRLLLQIRVWSVQQEVVAFGSAGCPPQPFE